MQTFLSRLLRLYRNSFSGLPPKVWFLALVMLVNRSGAMVVAFLTVYLVNARGFSLTDAGYVMAAFGSGGILGNYVGGVLNDRYGSWHIMFYSTIGAGLLHFGLGQFTEFTSLLVLAFAVSLVADAFRPAARAAIAIYSPRERLTQAYGLQRLAVNLGFSIGPALGGVLAFYYGYDLLFIVDGATYLLAALVFFIVLPPDETARARTQGEWDEAEGKPAGSTPSVSGPGLLQPWLLTMGLANTFIVLCFFQFFSTVPVYLTDIGYDERAIGLVTTVSGLLIVALEMPMVYSAERRFRPIPVMLCGGFLILVGYFVLPWVTTGFVLLTAFSAIITIGEILYMPFTNSYVAKWAPPVRRGEYLGILSASYSLAFVLGPMLGFGIAERYDYVTAFYVSCGVAGLGILLLSRVNVIRKAAKQLKPARPLPS